MSQKNYKVGKEKQLGKPIRDEKNKKIREVNEDTSLQTETRKDYLESREKGKKYLLYIKTRKTGKIIVVSERIAGGTVKKQTVITII